MDDYLSKPVNVLQLREALEKCMPIGIENKSTSGKESALRQADLQDNSASPAASIDIAQLKEYFPYEGEDVKMILNLAEEFLTDTEKRLQALENACMRQDANAIREGAHSIKGASLTFGAVPFSQLSKELETMGENGNLENAKEKLEEIQNEFNKMRAKLLRILSEMLP